MAPGTSALRAPGLRIILGVLFSSPARLDLQWYLWGGHGHVNELCFLCLEFVNFLLQNSSFQARFNNICKRLTNYVKSLRFLVSGFDEVWIIIQKHLPKFKESSWSINANKLKERVSKYRSAATWILCHDNFGSLIKPFFEDLCVCAKNVIIAPPIFNEGTLQSCTKHTYLWF